MKTRSYFLGHFLANMFIGFASLLAIQCACQPNFEVPKDQTIEPGKKDKSGTPNESGNPTNSDMPQKSLNPITDEMIQAAEKASKHFLAQQLKKLQKEEDLAKRDFAYINDRDGGITALYEAADAFFQRPDIVQVLLERGADPNIEDSASDTLLGAAVSSPSISENGLKTIELLLEAGADPFGGKKGFGPMYSVIDNSDKDTRAFELILSKMPTIITTKDDNGDTVLHYAVSLEREKAIKLLLIGKRANPNVVNNNNQSPRDLAKRKHKGIRALFGLS